MKTRDIPNLISAVRLFLVFPIIILIVQARFGWALGLFVIAGLSDGVDGYLAKHYGWVSRLGSFLDPLADKLLLISVYLACGWLSLVPAWLVAVVVARDVTIVTGAIVYHYRFGPFEGEPLLSSKLNTLVHLVLLTAVLANQAIMPLDTALLNALIVLALITTVCSGALYVYEWGQRAKAHDG